MESRRMKKVNQIRNRRIRRLKKWCIYAVMYLLLLAMGVCGLLGMFWILTNATVQLCIMVFLAMLLLSFFLFFCVPQDGKVGIYFDKKCDILVE